MPETQWDGATSIWLILLLILIVFLIFLPAGKIW